MAAEMGTRRSLAVRRGPWIALAGVTLLAAWEFAVETMTLHLGVRGDAEASTVPWYTLLQPLLAALGAVVASRQPRNPVGWIMLGAAVLGSLSGSAHAYALWGLYLAPGTLPRPDIAAWLVEPIGDPGLGLLLTFGLLLFPDGHLPSRRWRPVAWLAAGSAVAAWPRFLDPGFAPENLPELVNPFGVQDQAWAAVLHAWGGITGFAWLVAVLLSAVSLVVRYRGAGRQQRLQIKWFALGATLVAVNLAVAFVLGMAIDGDHPVAVPLFLASLGLLPVFMAIGIVRHNLFDIERLVSRTVSYTLLTAVLVGVYAAVVLTAQQVLGPADAPDWLVAGATLLAAGLFRPLRSRIQRGVDRRFNRARYDAAGVVEELAAGLRDEITLDGAAGRLQAAATASLQPASVSVWLRTERSR